MFTLSGSGPTVSTLLHGLWSKVARKSACEFGGLEGLNLSLDSIINQLCDFGNSVSFSSLKRRLDYEKSNEAHGKKFTKLLLIFKNCIFFSYKQAMKENQQ